MGSGNKGGSNPQTTTSTSGPPANVSAAYDALIGRATNVANQPLQQYQGAQIAGFSPMQQRAMETISNAQGTATPYINTAAQYTAAGAAPVTPTQFSQGAVEQYLSPYTQNVIDSTQAQFNNQNQQAQQDVISNAIKSGAWGGDRAGIAQAELANQQQLAQAPVIAGLYNQGYGQALGQFNNQQQADLNAQTASRQLAQNAGFGFGNLGNEAQNSTLSGASAELQAGTLQQQLQQAQLNVPYQQFLQQQAYPFQTTGWLGNLTEGLGGGQGGTATTTSPGPDSMSQLGGLGIAGISAIGGTGGFGQNGWFSKLFSSTPTAAATGGRVPRAIGGRLGPQEYKIGEKNYRIKKAPGGLVSGYTQAPGYGFGIPVLGDVPGMSSQQNDGGLTVPPNLTTNYTPPPYVPPPGSTPFVPTAPAPPSPPSPTTGFGGGAFNPGATGGTDTTGPGNDGGLGGSPGTGTNSYMEGTTPSRGGGFTDMLGTAAGKFGAGAIGTLLGNLLFPGVGGLIGGLIGKGLADGRGTVPGYAPAGVNGNKNAMDYIKQFDIPQDGPGVTSNIPGVNGYKDAASYVAAYDVPQDQGAAAIGAQPGVNGYSNAASYVAAYDVPQDTGPGNAAPAADQSFNGYSDAASYVGAYDAPSDSGSYGGGGTDSAANADGGWGSYADGGAVEPGMNRAGFAGGGYPGFVPQQGVSYNPGGLFPFEMMPEPKIEWPTYSSDPNRWSPVAAPTGPFIPQQGTVPFSGKPDPSILNNLIDSDMPAGYQPPGLAPSEPDSGRTGGKRSNPTGPGTRFKAPPKDTLSPTWTGEDETNFYLDTDSRNPTPAPTLPSGLGQGITGAAEAEEAPGFIPGAIKSWADAMFNPPMRPRSTVDYPSQQYDTGATPQFGLADQTPTSGFPAPQMGLENDQVGLTRAPRIDGAGDRPSPVGQEGEEQNLGAPLSPQTAAVIPQSAPQRQAQADAAQWKQPFTREQGAGMDASNQDGLSGIPQVNLAPPPSEVAEREEAEGLTAPRPQNAVAQFAQSPWMAGLSIGAGMLASKSPNFGQALGEGLQHGVQTIGQQQKAAQEQERTDLTREDQKSRAKDRKFDRKIAVRKLDSEIKRWASQDLETKRGHDIQEQHYRDQARDQDLDRAQRGSENVATYGPHVNEAGETEYGTHYTPRYGNRPARFEPGVGAPKSQGAQSLIAREEAAIKLFGNKDSPQARDFIVNKPISYDQLKRDAARAVELDLNISSIRDPKERDAAKMRAMEDWMRRYQSLSAPGQQPGAAAQQQPAAGGSQPQEVIQNGYRFKLINGQYVNQGKA